MLYERYPVLKDCKDDISAALELMIDTYRSGGGIGVALVDSMENAEITNEKIIDAKVYI